MAEAYGAEAVEMGAGGSIPFIADLVERFPGAQILITGVEDPDSRAHSPNESLHLRHLPARDPRRDLPARSHEQQASRVARVE